MTAVEIEISPLAYAKIIDWTSSNTEREVGGYLIGTLEKKKITITEAFFATAESNPTFVSFDNMMQFRILEKLEERGKGEMICGWWHTHPNLGVFMSGTDVATQQIYQALLPEAIAMVNDGNTFARTRKQKDYKAKFFRIGSDGKSFEVSYNVLTNPNELVDLLTNHVQDQENAEKIAENTAMRMSLSIDQSLENLAEKTLVSKDDFTKADTVVKKGLASTRSDLEKIAISIDEMKKSLVNKEDFNKFRTRWKKEFQQQRIILFATLGVALLNTILIITTLILTSIG